MDIAQLVDDLEEARARVKLALDRHLGGTELDAAFEAELQAERALAAARGEEYADRFELGLEWDAGAPLPHLMSSGHHTFVAFYLREPDPNWDGTYVTVVDPKSEAPASLGLAEFKHCTAVKMGSPNDEVLHGHPLHGRGLGAYGAYLVQNSRWIAELMKINSVHHFYRPENWAEARHFLFVFHDEILEAVAHEVEVERRRESMPALLAQTLEKL